MRNHTKIIKFVSKKNEKSYKINKTRLKNTFKNNHSGEIEIFD